MWLLHSHPGCSLQLLLWDLSQTCSCVLFSWLWASTVLARERSTEGVHVRLQRVSSALLPCTWVQEQCALFSPCRGVKRLVHRLRKTGIRDWFRSLPGLQNRAQCSWFCWMSALGLQKKGSKWTPKIKITAKSWAGSSLCSTHSWWCILDGRGQTSTVQRQFRF